MSDQEPPREVINPYRAFVGSWVPNWLMERAEISPGAKLTYGRLAQHAGKDGDCRPRQEVLAQELGVGDRQIRRYLAELEESWLIREIRMGRGQANRYKFYAHPWMNSMDPLPIDWSHLSTQDVDRTDTSTQSPLDWTDPSGPDRTHPSTPIRRESVEEKKTARRRARNPNGDARWTPPAGPVPTVTPDETRCRHRNNPDECGACNTAPGVPPPPTDWRKLTHGGAA